MLAQGYSRLRKGRRVCRICKDWQMEKVAVFGCANEGPDICWTIRSS